MSSPLDGSSSRSMRDGLDNLVTFGGSDEGEFFLAMLPVVH